MGKAEFWLRFTIWIGLAAVAPVTFLFVKYGMVSEKSGGYGLTGWGILALIVVSIVMFVLVKDVIKGLPHGSFIRQCVKGFLSLIPLFLMVMLIHSVKDSIAQFEEFLVFLLICEAAAVPVNPFPKWSEENHIDMQKRTFSEAAHDAIDYFFRKKDGK